MSNKRFRVSDVLAQPRADVLAGVQRQQWIDDAIARRYAALGGMDLDVMVKTCQHMVANGLVCREAESERLKLNPRAMRERGERPIVSASEGRLAAHDLVRFMEIRAAIKAQARTEIMETLNALKPETEADLRVALDAAAGGLTPQTKVAVAAEADLAGKERLVNELFDALTPEDQIALARAVEKDDMAAVAALLEKQSPELRRKFGVQPLSKVAAA